MELNRRKFIQLLGLTAVSAPVIVRASALEPEFRTDKRAVVQLKPYEKVDYFETADEQIISYELNQHTDTHVHHGFNGVNTRIIGPEFMDLSLSIYVSNTSKMARIEMHDIVNININHVVADYLGAMRWDVSNKMMLVDKRNYATIQELGICDLHFEQVTYG